MAVSTKIESIEIKKENGSFSLYLNGEYRDLRNVTSLDIHIEPNSMTIEKKTIEDFSL